MRRQSSSLPTSSKAKVSFSYHTRRQPSAVFICSILLLILAVGEVVNTNNRHLLVLGANFGSTSAIKPAAAATTTTNQKNHRKPLSTKSIFDNIKEIMPQPSKSKAGTKTSAAATSSSSASVLNELKDTIKRQADEIDSLKHELRKGTSGGDGGGRAGQSHGHGGGEPSPQEVASYLHDAFYKISFRRVGWLGLFLTSLSGTALIMNVFEHTLEKHIELAYFVPLLAGHGGNTGGQTVGTVISALSTGTIHPRDAPRVILKEALGGALSGTILSCIVSPLSYGVLGLSFHVAVVLFFTLPLVSMIAASLGSMIPFLCVFTGLDPSVIAAPAMTSIVDITGLMSYFLIANYIFKLYGLEL
jgi:cation transporter-like permease